MACLQVDCTVEVDLCREHQITGFPSIRVFRSGVLRPHPVSMHPSLSSVAMCPECLQATKQVENVWEASACGVRGIC